MREYFEQVEEEDNALPIGVGDCLDDYRTTDRNAIRTALVNSDAWKRQDKTVRGLVDEFAEFINKHCPSFGKKAICLIDGNHGWKFQDGTTDVNYLCSLLGVRYARKAAFVRLTVARKRTHQNIFIVAHHGYGTTGGSPALDLRKMEVRVEPAFDADIYLQAHSHQRGFVKIPCMAMSDQGTPRLVEKTKLLVRCGAFYKTYLENQEPGYGEEKLCRATDLGWVRILIHCERDKLGLMRFRYEAHY